MSNPALSIEFTPAAQKVLNRYETLPQTMMPAIAAALDKQNELTLAHIRRAYLSFPKQGKPVATGLRVQTDRLRAASNTTKASISGNEVRSSIGCFVKYAALHEFGGGPFTRTQKAGTVRLRTDAGGNLIRQGKNGKLAIFAKNTHKRAKEVAHQGSTYTVTYPARGMFRRGIEDKRADYSRRISAAIIAVAQT